MEHEQPSLLQKGIIREAQIRSGIEISTDHEQHKLYSQLDVTKLKGSYIKRYTNSGHLIWEKIFLNVSYSDEHATSIIFHELAHATGFRTRLNRTAHSKSSKALSATEYNIEEAIAETAALLLMNHFYLSTNETTAFSNRYINQHTWHIQDPAINDSIVEQAVHAKEYILQYWLPAFDREYQPVRKEAA